MVGINMAWVEEHSLVFKATNLVVALNFLEFTSVIICKNCQPSLSTKPYILPSATCRTDNVMSKVVE